MSPVWRGKIAQDARCRICMCDLSVTHAPQSTLRSVSVVSAWTPSVSLRLKILHFTLDPHLRPSSYVRWLLRRLLRSLCKYQSSSIWIWPQCRAYSIYERECMWECVCVCNVNAPACSCSPGRVRHDEVDPVTILCSTPASLAAVCQRGPIHRWMVAWQQGPCSANQGRMQQGFSPWHIKRERPSLSSNSIDFFFFFFLP